MVDRQATAYLSVAACKNSDACDQLLITIHEYSIAKCYFPFFGRSGSSSAPDCRNDTRIDTVHMLIGNKADGVIDDDDCQSKKSCCYEAYQDLDTVNMGC